MRGYSRFGVAEIFIQRITFQRVTFIMCFVFTVNYTHAALQPFFRVSRFKTDTVYTERHIKVSGGNKLAVGMNQVTITGGNGGFERYTVNVDFLLNQITDCDIVVINFLSLGNIVSFRCG